MTRVSVMNNAREHQAVKNQKFIHNYPSCARTYATLCIYHRSLEPKEITAMLNLNPDRVVKKGELSAIGTIPSNGWFVTTQAKTNSRDLRFHIALLMKKLMSRRKKLVSLHKKGCELRLMCFWESASGNGGPCFDHVILQKMSTLPLDLDLDIWFAGEK